MTNEKSIENGEEKNNPEKRNSIIGAAEVLIGSLAVGGALEGIDSHEAATPSDALGSIYVGDSAAFVTQADLGFGVLAGAGLALIAHGVKRGLRSR